MSKKSFYVPCAFLLALAIVLPCADLFAAMSVSISPPKMEFNIEPGKTAKEIIEVKNQGETPAKLKVYVTGFSISERGDLNYKPGGSNSAAGWIRAVPGEMSINPADYNVVRYEIAVPGGTPNGTYTASVQVEEDKGEKASGEGVEMQIKGRLAYIIYVNVGKPSYTGSIESFNATTAGDKITFRARLRNNGIYYIRPRGKIIIEKDGKKVKEEPYPNLPLLAGQRRTTEVTVPKDLGSGTYSAKVSIDIGSGKILDAVTSFSL